MYPKSFSNNCEKTIVVNERTLNKLHQNKRKGKQPLIIWSQAVNTNPTENKKSTELRKFQGMTP